MNYKSINDFYQKQESDTLKNITLVSEGEDKCKYYFTKDFLKTLYLSAKEQEDNEQYPNSKGIKCRFGHPSLLGSKEGTFIGRFKNITYVSESTGDYLKADLHFNDISKSANIPNGGMSIYQYINDIAKSDPQAIGASIMFDAEKLISTSINNKTLKAYEGNGKLTAIDIVDSPAATNGLFTKSQDANLLKDILKSVKNTYNAITNLSKKQQKMEKKELTLTTSTGEHIIVDTENETPSVGDSVTMENGEIPEEITLNDGTILKIENGTITEIVEKPKTDDIQQENSNLKKEIEDLKSQLKSKQTEEQTTKQILTELQGEMKSIKSQFTSKQVNERTISTEAPKNVEQELQELLN